MANHLIVTSLLDLSPACLQVTGFQKVVFIGLLSVCNDKYVSLSVNPATYGSVLKAIGKLIMRLEPILDATPHCYSQWGVVDSVVANQGITITFPISFTTVYELVITPTHNGDLNTYPIVISTLKRLYAAMIQSNINISANVQWIAIGY